MRVPVCAALLTALSLAVAASAAPKPKVPALLERAQYIAFAYDLGDHFVSESQVAAAPEILPEERRALEAIHDDIEKWGRYVVTDRLDQAEIIIAIRLGRRGTMEVGRGSGGVIEPPFGAGPTGRPRQVGQNPGGTGGQSTVVGAQLSSNEDRLDVYESRNGTPGMRLWSAAEFGGLAGTPPSVYKALRKDIEAAAAAKAAKKP
jgi:hypothetical protein